MIWFLLACASEQPTQTDTGVVARTLADPPPWALRVEGAGFEPGTELLLGLLEDGVLAQTGQVSATDGTFLFQWTGALAEGPTYQVHAAVDGERRGYCEDHDSWVIEVAAQSGEVVSVDAAQTTDPRACATFPPPSHHSVTFGGLLFEHAKGVTLFTRLHLRDASMDDEQVIDGNGAFAFDWPDIAPHGAPASLDYFVDLDGDGVCGAGDEAWSIDLGTITAWKVVGVGYDPETSDLSVCARW